ncbi:MAG: hypothetical protein JOY90_09730 [Bradyrhizobium sp.]|uniref:hypothetical protein n=1 Tax=Bradyrhizobium sp. TaxID=376 RepID=UPI001DE51A1A|nr:hypothetical protein [Bradyrhizobium sp.]MBV9560723.1 hypothetical protein [Bradyrhizobium sp.]
MTADEDDDDRGSAAASRRGRLKLKLRENLKRRKVQARERGKVGDAPSIDHETSPGGEVGKARG